KLLPPARLALVFSAAVARLVSLLMAVFRALSADIARPVSVVIAPLRLLRSVVRFVTCDSLMLPVMVLAVPVTLPLMGLLKVLLPVQVLLPLSRLELELVTSDKKAIDWVALFLSWNCRWLSALVNHTSPESGLVGAAPVLGRLIEA